MTTVTVREATEPPEARGITRDAVRMMVAHRADLSIVHAHAHDLPQFLDEGDLVVVNTSGTLAAALDALGEDGTPLVVHLSQRLPAGLWLVELRRPNGRATEPWFEDPPGPTLRLVGGGFVHLATRFESSTRLWVATLDLARPAAHLPRGARPPDPLRLRDARLAARHLPDRLRASRAAPRCRARAVPFTPELVTRLVAKGVGSRRSCCTPACRRSRRTSTRTRSGTASRRRRPRGSTRPATTADA